MALRFVLLSEMPVFVVRLTRSRLALICSTNLVGTDADRGWLATMKGTTASRISLLNTEGAGRMLAFIFTPSSRAVNDRPSLFTRNWTSRQGFSVFGVSGGHFLTTID
jgi:hypothetical protein